jgi:lipopolysaccharide biosynthesis regulator YciM
METSTPVPSGENLFWVLALAGLLAVAVAVIWLAARRLTDRRPRAGELYVEGLEAIAGGDTTRAVRLLRSAVEQDSDHIGAYLQLGRLIRLRGDHDRALRIHRELLVRNLTDRDRRQVLLEVVHDLAQAGRWPEAKQEVRALIERDSENEAVLRLAGKIHENLRDWDAAYALFEQLEKRQRSPSKRRLSLYRAFIGFDYMKRGKLKEAKHHFEAALKLEPTLPGALLYLGDIYAGEGNGDKAIETWKNLIHSNPNAVSLVFERLEHATYDKDPTQVTELAAEYERILSEHTNDVSTMRALARLHRRRGDSDEALRVLDHALELRPDSHRLRLERAKLKLRTGKRNEVLQELTELLEATAPGNARGFTCHECGYRSEEYLWRCPSCHRWETFEE